LHYCDGAIRQMTPLSPALHLGADKLFIVGLTSQRPRWSVGRSVAPSRPRFLVICSIVCLSTACRWTWSACCG
jgi:predicted acylesterase/phospholipase RssA